MTPPVLTPPRARPVRTPHPAAQPPLARESERAGAGRAAERAAPAHDTVTRVIEDNEREDRPEAELERPTSSGALGATQRSHQVREAASAIAARIEGITTATQEHEVIALFDATLARGETPSERNRIARQLLDELREVHHIGLDRLVDELEHASATGPSDRARLLDATLPIATAEEKAAAVDTLIGNWFTQLLNAIAGIFGARADEHAAVLQIFESVRVPGERPPHRATVENFRELYAATSRRGRDFELIYDALPSDAHARAEFTRLAAAAMDTSQRADAIVSLVQGRTPREKEIAIGLLLQGVPGVAERQEILRLVEERGGISYDELCSNLSAAADRAYFLGTYLRPSDVERLRRAGVPLEVDMRTLAGIEGQRLPGALELSALSFAPFGDAQRSAERAQTALAPATEDLAARSAAARAYGEAITEGLDGVEGRLAAARAAITRLDAEIEALGRMRAGAASVQAAQTGSDPRARQLSAHASDGRAYAEERLANLAAMRADLVRSIDEVEHANVAPLLRESAERVAHAETLLARFGTLSERERATFAALQAAAPGSEEFRRAAAALEDPAPLEAHLAALQARLGELGATRQALLEARGRSTSAAALVDGSNAVQTMEAELATLGAHAQLVTAALLEARARARLSEEGRAAQTLADGRRHVLEASRALETASDAALDAWVPRLRADAAAAAQTHTRLQNAARDARRVIAELGPRARLDEAQLLALLRNEADPVGRMMEAGGLSANDVLALVIAGMTLRGVSPSGARDGGTLSLDDQIAAAREMRDALVQTRTLIEARREGLRTALNGRLSALGLAPIAGSDDASLQEGMRRVAARLGMAAPTLPTGPAFGPVNDAVAAFMQTALQRQQGMFMVMVQMLDHHFGMRPPGVTVDVRNGVPVARIPTQAPPPPATAATLDLAAFDAQFAASSQLLTRALGMSGLDEGSSAALAQVAANEATAPAASVPLMAALERTLNARQMVSAADFDELRTLVRSGRGELATLERIARDPSEPMARREAARKVVQAPELRSALCARGALELSRIDAVQARANAMRGELSGRLPVSHFYASARSDVDTVHRLLADEDNWSSLVRLFSRLTRERRQWLVAEYEAVHGENSFGQRLEAEGWDGRELSYVIDAARGETPQERALVMQRLMDQHGSWTQVRSETHLLDMWINGAQQYHDLLQWDDNFVTRWAARPSDTLMQELQGHIDEARRLRGLYEAARDATPPAANLRELRGELLVACARAEDLATMLTNGSMKSIDRGIAIARITTEVSVAVAITAAATAVTLATLGAAAPEGAGVAGASWTAVAGSVAAGTGAGTTLGFGIAVIREASSSSEFDWSNVGSRTRDAFTMSFAAALTAGVSVATMARIGAAAVDGGRIAQVVMNNPLLRYGTNAGIMMGTTAVGEGLAIGTYAATGDMASARQRAHELGPNVLRAGVGALILGPISARLPSGALWRIPANAALGAGEHMVWQRIHGRPLSEGLAQAVMSGVVVGEVFHHYNNVDVARRMRGASIEGHEVSLPRRPGRWTIAQVHERAGNVTLRNGAGELRVVPAAELLAANRDLLPPVSRRQTRAREAMPEELPAALLTHLDPQLRSQIAELPVAARARLASYVNAVNEHLGRAATPADRLHAIASFVAQAHEPGGVPLDVLFAPGTQPQAATALMQALAHALWASEIQALQANRPANAQPFEALYSDANLTVARDRDGNVQVYQSRRDVRLAAPSEPPVLTQEQVQGIVAEWQRHVQETNYNNGAMTLEFMAFLREARAQNPNLSITDAFAMWQTSSTDIVRHYGGGNCFALAEDLQARLASQGIPSHVLGQRGFNQALRLPDRSDWVEGLHYVDRAHGSLVVPYRTPDGRVRYLHMEMGTGHDMQPVDHASLDAIRAQQYVDPELAILNTSDIIRNQVRTRNKIVIMDMNQQNGPLLMLDMVSGKMTLRNVPGLATPGVAREVVVNFMQLATSGQHERLVEVLQAAGSALNQPPSFVQDMLTLIGTRMQGDYAQLMLPGARQFYTRSAP